ncbi:MAG: putative flagellar assembly protein FliH [Microvirga sp.]|nr:putative flagellar assembly protein FliH [Microvirga sp.]
MRRAESEGAEKVARLEAAAISRLENERQLLIGELQEIRKRLSSSLEAIEAQRRELLEQSERFAVTVAYTAVSRIVGALAEEGRLVGALVSRAVEESRLGGPFVVRVAKEDHGQLLSLALPEGLSVELLPDEKLKPGSCVVEFENGSMDAGLDAQLVAIKDALLRSLSDGRAEAS